MEHMRRGLRINIIKWNTRRPFFVFYAPLLYPLLYISLFFPTCDELKRWTHMLLIFPLMIKTETKRKGILLIPKKNEEEHLSHLLSLLPLLQYLHHHLFPQVIPPSDPQNIFFFQPLCTPHRIWQRGWVPHYLTSSSSSTSLIPCLTD